VVNTKRGKQSDQSQLTLLICCTILLQQVSVYIKGAVIRLTTCHTNNLILCTISMYAVEISTSQAS